MVVGLMNQKNEVSSADSRMKDVMIYTPFNFKDLSDGYDPELQLTNPLISVADNDRIQKRQTFNYNGSFTWEIIENLKVKTEFGLDQYYSKDNRFFMVLPLINHVKTVTNNRLLSLLAKTENHFVIPQHTEL